MLLFQLTVSVILEGSKLQRLISSLILNLLLQIILAVVNFLHDILFTLNSCLYFAIELVLKTYRKVKKLLDDAQEIRNGD